MNELAKMCIERVYVKKDYQFFREMSKQIPTYLKGIEELTCSIYKEVRVYSLENEPAIEIWFEFEKYIDNQFDVEYKTLLKISKVANLFVFQHEFSVENKDPNRMAPVLDGFGEEPYTIFQSKLEKKIVNFLEKQNLQKLQLSEMDEVIEGITVPEQSIFGSQMTLENALFRDLYEICEA